MAEDSTATIEAPPAEPKPQAEPPAQGDGGAPSPQMVSLEDARKLMQEALQAQEQRYLTEHGREKARLSRERDAAKLAASITDEQWAALQERSEADADYDAALVDQYKEYKLATEDLAPFSGWDAKKKAAERLKAKFASFRQDYDARWQALAKTSQERAPGTGLPPVGGGGKAVVDKDNIDQLYLDGKVSEDQYRRFRQTGVIS